MKMVFQVGKSDFPAKEYYYDEAWTQLKDAQKSASAYAGTTDIDWVIVTGINDSPVLRGKFYGKGNSYESYMWIKPIVLNEKESRQDALLKSLGW